MTEPRSLTAAVYRLLADLPEPVTRELRVAEPVWRFLRDRYTTAIRPEIAHALMGASVVVDTGLTGGQWQWLEDGEVAAAGDMAPPPDGMTVDYDPIAGWIAIASELLEPPDPVIPRLRPRYEGMRWR